MANVIINDTNLTNIANAIREKNGSSDKYKPNQMAAAILAIEAGGGSGGGELEVPDRITLTVGTVSNGNAWDWVWQYMPSVTYDMYNASSEAFSYVGAEVDLSHINVIMGGNYNINKFFAYGMFTQAPNLIVTASLGNTNAFFGYCSNLRSLPEDYFMLKDANTQQPTGGVCFNGGQSRFGSFFNSCYSLRRLPKLNDGTQYAVYDHSNASYEMMFYSCYALDYVKDLPVVSNNYTSDVLSYMAKYCYHLEDFKFETQANGTPFTANWSNQLLDLTGVGYFPNASTAVSQAHLDSEHQATSMDDIYRFEGSNDEELMYGWWTTDINLSRYNRRSARNTINSLPNVSSGTGNIIKFTGNSGKNNSLSDDLGEGGKISDLSEEEIAVAAAKGWTVTFA